MLEILVNITKQTEYVDNDLASVFEHIEDVSLDLKNLKKSKGSNYKSVFKELASGKLSQWEGAGEDLKKSECDNVYGEVCKLYLKQLEERFQDAQGKLGMFLFFSMRVFRRSVSNA